MALERLFGSRTRARLLALLLPEPERTVGLREAARVIGVSPNSVQHEADNLVALGILSDDRVGTSRRFRADPSHPLYADLRSIVINSAIARGSDDSRSDIDVMVLGTADPALVYAAARVAQDSVRRPVRPSVFTRGELEDRAARGDAFAIDVLAGPKIVLLGSLDGLGSAGEGGSPPKGDT